MKYSTLAELTQAFRDHELPEHVYAEIDKYEVYVTVNDPVNDPGWLHAEDVFKMHVHDVLEQALDLLGIRHEHV